MNSVVVNSYDPNDIVESHGPQIDIDEFTSDDYLYYTVRFQNTGTAEAINVRIENTLDSQLDADSFRVVGSSHYYVASRNGSDLVFRFNYINLTWQSNDEMESQGWIMYKVKANAGFEVGDVIPNTAEIYFDTNPAIVTNTFETTFVDALGTSESQRANASIFPNPTNGNVSVISSDEIESVEMYNAIGTIAKKFSSVNALSTILDISELPTGIYFMKILTKNNFVLTRKLIRK